MEQRTHNTRDTTATATTEFVSSDQLPARVHANARISDALEKALAINS